MSQRNTTVETFKGIGTLLLCHLIFEVILVLVISAISRLGLTALTQLVGVLIFAIGFSQLTYVVPLGHHFARQRRFDAMRGVIIGAVITVFLNGGCFAYFLWSGFL